MTCASVFSRAACAIALVFASGCGLRRAPAFGAPCESDRGCAPGLVCVGGRGTSACLPPAPPPPPETRGRACDDALPLYVGGAPYAGEVTVPFTEHDTDERTLAHAAGRALHVQVELPEGAGDTVLRAQITAPFPARIVWSDVDACDSEDRYDTSPPGTNELVVPRATPGRHHLVIVADLAARADAVTISVEQALCPAGSLPKGEGCFGFVTFTDADPRVAHGIGFLPDQRVVAAGGDSPDDRAAVTADLFDTRTGRLSSTPLPYARSGAPGVVLYDGSFMLVGGARSDNGAASIARLPAGSSLFEEYDENFFPTLDFQQGCVAAPVPFGLSIAFATCPQQAPSFYEASALGGDVPCSDDSDCPGLDMHCLADLQDGEVDGGWCACTNDACLDPFQTALWNTILEPAGVPRSAHYAVILAGSDGAVLFGGGYARGLDTASSPFILAPAGRALSPLLGRAADSLTPRANGGAARAGTRLTVAGGTGLFGDPALTTVDIFDPRINREADHVELQLAREDTAVVALDDARVIVIGGRVDGAPTAATEIIDARALTVARGPELPVALAQHQAVALGDGTAIVIGGREANGAYASALYWLKPFAPTLDPADTVFSGRIEGDRCNDPLPLPADQGSILADTVGFGRDYSGSRFGSCTSNFASQGPDVVYALHLPRARTFTASVESGQPTDLSLYVLSSCDDGEHCVAGSDQRGASPGAGGREELVVDAADVDRDLFVIVDSALVFNGFTNLDAPYDYHLTWAIE